MQGSSALRVAGPMAQICACSARRSRREWSSRSRKKRTPLALVKISQSYASSSRDGAIERRRCQRRPDLDDRQFDRVGAQRAQLRGELAGLARGARDHDAAAEQRQPLEPVQLVAQPTTSPTMMVAGGFSALFEQNRGRVASVPVMVS